MRYTVATNVILQIQQMFVSPIKVQSVCFQSANDFALLGASETQDPSLLWLNYHLGFHCQLHPAGKKGTEGEESINFL